MKKAITLEIAGASYRMMVDADEQHMRRLCALVNERVEALGEKAHQKASPTQLLAMVALSLADDLVVAETRARTLEERTRQALTSAIARIDRRLEADVVSPADA